MEMKIVEKKNNPLLKREDVLISLKHSGTATPSRNAILAQAEKELKASKDLIVVDRIMTKRGMSLSEVKILVYKKKEEIPQGKIKKMEKSSKTKAEGAKKQAEVKTEKKPAAEKEGKPSEKKESVKEASKEVPKAEKPTEEEAKKEGKPKEEPKADKPAEKKKEEPKTEDKKPEEKKEEPKEENPATQEK